MGKCMPEEYRYLNYARTKLKDDAVLVDVGMNMGEFTDGFLERFSKCSVCGIEPIPKVYEKVVAKFAHLKDRVKIWNVAVGDQQKLVKLYLGGSPELLECSSLFFRSVFSKSEIEVEMLQLDDLDLPEVIDYLKIDAEGGELIVLKGAKNFIKKRKIKFIQFEAGECYPLAGITMNNVVRFLYPYYTVYNEKLESLPEDFNLERYDGVVRNFLAELK